MEKLETTQHFRKDQGHQVWHSSSTQPDCSSEAGLDYVKTCPENENFKSNFLVSHIKFKKKKGSSFELIIDAHAE